MIARAQTDCAGGQPGGRGGGGAGLSFAPRWSERATEVRENGAKLLRRIAERRAFARARAKGSRAPMNY